MTLDNSIVIPVYKNASGIPKLFDELTKFIKRTRNNTEVVFVVDGSPDDSIEIIRHYATLANFQIQIIEHSRNFGAFEAIRTGLRFANGENIVVMAADLQEPIELARDILKSLSSGQCDVAVGVRRTRKDPTMSKLLSQLFWSTYRKFVNREIPAGGVDVFGCKRDVARNLVEFKESHSSLVAQLFWVGYRRISLPYDRVERESGKSSWSFKKKFAYMSDSVFSFTSLPIRAVLYMGTVGLIAAALLSIVVFISWSLGNNQTPGYSATMLVILASASANLLGIGIVGNYVWRTYENSKNRPTSLTRSQEFFDARGIG